MVSHTTTTVNRVATTSHVNYSYLSTPEKLEWLKRLHKENRLASMRITRLKAMLAKVIAEKGILAWQKISASDGRGRRASVMRQCKARLLSAHLLGAAEKSSSLQWQKRYALESCNDQMVPFSVPSIKQGL